MSVAKLMNHAALDGHFYRVAGEQNMGRGGTTVGLQWAKHGITDHVVIQAVYKPAL